MRDATIILASLFMCALSSCDSVAQDEVNGYSVSVIQKSVALCVQRYEERTGQSLSSDIDRAYVHVSLDRFGIFFTHGEVGSFGPRSRDYEYFFGCGVHVSSSQTDIYYLGKPEEDAIIDRGMRTIDRGFYGEQVEEAVFMRSGVGFVFKAKQLLKREYHIPQHVTGSE